MDTRILKILGPILVASSLIFLGASCTLINSSRYGAIVKSQNSGESWESKSLMRLDKNRYAVLGNGVNITSITFDPRNSQVLFAGTQEHGLFATDNGGDSWTQLLPRQVIVDVVPDSNVRCLLYVATPARIFKTSDCATTWQVIYNETRNGVAITSIAADQLTPTILYLTTSTGDLLKSTDRGETWSVLHRFDRMHLVRILVDPSYPEILYVADTEGNIYRSFTHGLEWNYIADSLRGYYVPLVYRTLFFLSRQDNLFFASESSLFITRNAGTTWERLPLLTQPAETHIFTAAVNPLNDNEIYYGTKNTLYHTIDNGAHWEVKPLPSPRAPSEIRIDPNNPRNVYMGFETYEAPSPYWNF
ncbi:hypothetical protein HY620_02580 [Candidatus Uhrbacteria bacterium]|nr:hypothetical protein [Candidatus Uhrbacteria bacterium]